jgi:uncharacterized protein (DUF58 family)
MADDAGPGLAELLADVRRIEVQSRRLATDVMAGGYLSVFRGAGLAFDTVREYAEGDDPRAVDWNVTARMGRPFVKTYVEERELTLLFLFDLSASMTGGFAPESPRHTAARVVACLALSAVRNGDEAGLVAFADGVTLRVPAGKGAGHALRIVRDCLALPAGPGRTDPAAALDLVARTVRRRAVVFLVSDFLFEPPARALATCARRHDLIAVRLLAPELDPPAGAGLVRVRDPETGRASVLDLGSARVRAEVARRVGAWRARTDEALARARVDVLDVPVPRVAGRDQVATAILRFFRMRELRGAKR